jgi:DNA-binding transcriptional regulator YdaS (Cro superfamily)
MSVPRDPSLSRAISKVGTALRLAQLLGLSPQAVSQWRRVPVSRVLDVERLSDVPRHELRPDIYPAPPPPQAVEWPAGIERPSVEREVA